MVMSDIMDSDFESRYDVNLNLKRKLDNVVEELYITSKFPPLTDVSGIVLSKRIIDSNKKVDVICSGFEGDKDYDFNTLISNFIEDKIVIDGNYTPSSTAGVNYFRTEGMKKLDELNKDYKTIVSRTWTLESHFLALDYKLKHPEVVWIAEFSDPLRLDINNNLRNVTFTADESYFTEINENINNLNNMLFGDDAEKYFPEIKSGDNLYFLVEYLPYLFADVVRFTNVNQQRIMLDSFPLDIADFVLDKSEVLNHPTLDKEYYYLKESLYAVDDDCLNFAYFGTYIGKRHLEYLFKPFEELQDEIKEKIRLYFFVPNPEFIKLSIGDLSIFDNIIIGDKIPFLEFLNLTTKMDILIVNDLLTKETFDINPYRPSKFADYVGSGSDIWFICEKNSSLDSEESKFKSYIDDYDSSKETLGKIIEDKLGTADAFDESLPLEYYYQTRLTNLNNVLDDTYKQRGYWVNQANLSKNKLNELNQELTAKDEELASLREDVSVKDNQLDSLKNDVISIKDEVKSLEKELNIITSEKNILNEGYNELHQIAKDSFDLLEVKDNIIADKNKELEYYKSHGNLFDRYVSSPLARIYLFVVSKRSERDINFNLYDLIKDLDWFNRGYYLSENKDISRLKWVKIFSPELHYVCHGFDEGRHPNRESNKANSKKDLVKFLSFIEENE